MTSVRGKRVVGRVNAILIAQVGPRVHGNYKRKCMCKPQGVVIVTDRQDHPPRAELSTGGLREHLLDLAFSV